MPAASPAMKFAVIADTREQGNHLWYDDGPIAHTMPGTFAHEGMTIRSEVREFGDLWVYLRGPVPQPFAPPSDWLVLERKTWPDLHGSVQDSGKGREDTRIRHQVRGLLDLQAQGYQCGFLIVGLLSIPSAKSKMPGRGVYVEVNGRRTKRNWSYYELEAARMSLEHVGLMTIISPSDFLVPRTVRAAAEVCARGEHFRPKGLGGLAPGLSVLAQVFTAVPDIGEATALAIAESVGTFERFYSMSVKDLQQIPTVGKVTAERLWFTFHEFEHKTVPLKEFDPYG